ncbi:hypothetical protein [Salana multivorans]
MTPTTSSVSRWLLTVTRPVLAPLGAAIVFRHVEQLAGLALLTVGAGAVARLAAQLGSLPGRRDRILAPDDDHRPPGHPRRHLAGQGAEPLPRAVLRPPRRVQGAQASSGWRSTVRSCRRRRW